MRSLDNYQRYIKQREDAANTAAQTNGADKNGTQPAANKTVSVSPPPAKTDAAKTPKTRYVLRGGVTVSVSDEDAAPAPAVEVQTAKPAQIGRTLSPPAARASRKPEPKAVVPGDVMDAKSEAADAQAQASSASLWERLPRHIQLLAQIPAPLEEEVAQKYYTRDFRETREQLIERLLDPPLTLEDTARVLGVCPATVRRYTNKGVLLHQRTVGQQRRFRLSDVLLFLEQNQSKSARPKKP